MLRIRLGGCPICFQTELLLRSVGTSMCRTVFKQIGQPPNQILSYLIRAKAKTGFWYPDVEAFRLTPCSHTYCENLHLKCNVVIQNAERMQHGNQTLTHLRWRLPV